MKKIVMSLLLLTSCAGFAADQSLVSLQQKGQAALKARNFAEVEQIIRDLRAQGSARQADSLRTQLLKAKAGAIEGDMFAQVAALQTEIDNLQLQLDQTIRRGDASEGQIADLRRQLQQALDRLANESVAAQQRIADLLAEAGVNKQVIDDLNAQLEQERKAKRSSIEKALQLAADFYRLENEMKELRKQLESKDPKGTINDLNKQIAELKKENDRLQEENDALQIKLTNVGQELAQKNAEIDSLKNQLQAANALKAQAEKGAQQCNDTLKKLQELLKTQSDQLKNNEDIINNLKNENIRLNTELDKLKAGGQGDSAECVVRIRELEANIVQLKKNITDRDAEINALNQDYEQQAEAVKQLTKENESFVESLKNSNPDAAAVIQKQQQQIQSLQKDLQSATATIESLTTALSQK